MTDQPPSNADFAAVCRDYSPAHAAVFLLVRSQPGWNLQRYASFLGMTETALIHIAEHLVSVNILTPFATIEVQTLPNLTPIDTTTDPKIVTIYNLLLANSDIIRLIRESIPSSKRVPYLRYLATLCADSEVKDPIKYARAIIRNYHKEPLYADDPDSRTQQGRTPIQPG
jgi:hypothetical protein